MLASRWESASREKGEGAGCWTALHLSGAVRSLLRRQVGIFEPTFVPEGQLQPCVGRADDPVSSPRRGGRRRTHASAPREKPASTRCRLEHLVRSNCRVTSQSSILQYYSPHYLMGKTIERDVCLRSRCNGSVRSHRMWPVHVYCKRKCDCDRQRHSRQIQAADPQCHSTGGYDDMNEGAQVKVTVDGKTVGTGRIERGVSIDGNYGCKFASASQTSLAEVSSIA